VLSEPEVQIVHWTSPISPAHPLFREFAHQNPAPARIIYAWGFSQRGRGWLPKYRKFAEKTSFYADAGECILAVPLRLFLVVIPSLFWWPSSALFLWPG